jgi:hypothetical protein
MFSINKILGLIKNSRITQNKLQNQTKNQKIKLTRLLVRNSLRFKSTVLYAVLKFIKIFQTNFSIENIEIIQQKKAYDS